MKKILLLSMSVVASGFCLAQDVGRVISATPIIQQQAVARQVCSTEQVAAQQSKSGAGALIGAIAGGAMGNAIGGGVGTVAATMLGLIGGAAIGDSIEGAPGAQMQNVQRCSTQSFYENRPVAYNVVYEFGGREYSVQMPNDPGPTIRLQVTPVGAEAATPARQTTVTYSQPVYVQPSNVVMVQPVNSGYYPVYYAAQPNYFPIGLAVGLGLGHWGGGRSHRHWR